MIVVKRNGSKVDYDKTKIYNAIKKSVDEYWMGGKKIDILLITNNVDAKLAGRNEVPVEEIQDLIVKELKKINEYVAYNYESYREKRQKLRKEYDEKFVTNKIQYIEEYKKAQNAASGSKYDANANVTSKNIATMASEINKYENILINRKMLTNKIAEVYGEDMAQKYLDMLENHELYTHDETSLMPYCTSITMYPFLFDGLTKLGGETQAPKHLSSFCGSFVNLVFAISSQFAGACATVEFLMYMDYFARKEYGEDYYLRLNDKVNNYNERTIKKELEGYLQQVVYSINQPAAARG